MKAILLGRDKTRNLMDYVVYKYNTLWPDNPLQFQMPYQELNTTNIKNVSLIKTSDYIKERLEQLTANVSDEEFVLWCMDDYYPIMIDKDKMEKNIAWMKTNDVNGLVPFKNNKALELQFRTLNSKILDDIYIDSSSKKVDKGWRLIHMHHFIKGKVLKEFINNMPYKSTDSNVLNYARQKLNPYTDIYFCTDSAMTISESTHYGKIYLDCYNDMIRDNFTPPRLEILNEKIAKWGQ